MSSTSSSSGESSNNGTPPRNMRSLDNLYEVSNPIYNDVTLYCHLAICDLIVFEEVLKDEKWRIAMDEEIALVEKNNTWK
jgi:hypothetical protein